MYYDTEIRLLSIHRNEPDSKREQFFAFLLFHLFIVQNNHNNPKWFVSKKVFAIVGIVLDKILIVLAFEDL